MISHPTGKSVDKVIESIKKSYRAGVYAPMIRSVQFLNYKNVANGKNLDFDFPITLIVGPNGTNKTSILRALESCPRGKSLSDYWFDTDLDPIPQSRSRLMAGAENPEYTYSYDLPENSRVRAKVMKYMTFKDGRDDYFEPAKRVDNDEYGRLSKKEQDSVSKYRKSEGWKPISKRVIYIDMRQRVPAYDINMSYGFSEAFFEDQNNHLKKELEGKYPGDRKKINDEYNKRKMTMKRYIRRASVRISEVFNGVNVDRNRTYYGKERFSGGVKELTNTEIRWVSYILGRNYTKIDILKHSYFKLDGVTVRVEVEDLENKGGYEASGRESIKRRYSEAYAGSGEYAVIMMVHNIYAAEEKTLILMDEPENSLHPESQRRLMEYILSETLKKKHQIIISTHSSYMSENLPNDARIALFLESGFVNPQMGVTHRGAFMGIGGVPEAVVGKIIIQAEDNLAARILREAIFRKSRHKMDQYEFKVFGGVNDAYNRLIPTYIKDFRKDVFLVFDGDQNYHDVNDISSRLKDKFQDEDSYKYISCKVALYLGRKGYVAVRDALEKDRFDVVESVSYGAVFLSGNTPQGEKHRKLKDALRWLMGHVHYLPGTPNEPSRGGDKEEEIGNPEMWMLDIMGNPVSSNEEAKNFFHESQEVMERACCISPDEVTSQDSYGFQVSKLKKFDSSHFDGIYEIISKFESIISL